LRVGKKRVLKGELSQKSNEGRKKRNYSVRNAAVTDRSSFGGTFFDVEEGKKRDHEEGGVPARKKASDGGQHQTSITAMWRVGVFA